jgi:DNA-binding NarL/FixJ family response regulator
VTPAQLVRAAGQLAKLTGTADDQRALVDLGERVTLLQVRDLVYAMGDVIDEQLPVATREASPRPARSGAGGWNETPADTTARILELAQRDDLGNEDIAAEAGVSLTTVSRVLRRAGVPPRKPTRRKKRSKIDQVGELAPRKTVPEIAAALGMTEGSVRTYLSRLKLRAKRTPDVDELD